MHGDPHFWPQWPVLDNAGCQSCTHLWLSGHKRGGNAPLLSSPTSCLFPPSGPPFLGAPRGTYSAASSTERHLRTLGSSNCAGPARWAHQEETQAAVQRQRGPLPRAAAVTYLMALQNVPVRFPSLTLCRGLGAVPVSVVTLHQCAKPCTAAHQLPLAGDAEMFIAEAGKVHLDHMRSKVWRLGSDPSAATGCGALWM